MSGVSIRGLRVIGPEREMVAALDAEIAPGHTLAVIGESGSGKTLTAKALVGLLPRGFRAEGAASVAGRELPLATTGSAWRAVRGGTVALLLQDPFTSLSPVHRCGDQIAWTVEAATGARLSRAARLETAVARLAEVKLPPEVARAYPHQLSGGMRQRVAIAAALAADPELLIADEPTTALDASNQAEILDLLRALQQRRQLSVVLISHDLGLVRGRTDDVLVMRHGEVVERGRTADVLAAPQHPYTRALIAADPVLAAGAAPVVRDVPTGPALVEVSSLVKQFGARTVLDDVALRIGEGEIVGVVGESGSGKSTLARCIAGLEQEDAGTITFAGSALAPGRASRTPAQMQIVFQDPYSSLNPMMSIGAILREALAVAKRPASDVAELLETVGLPAEFAAKRPAELSGGQRQRVAIARALAPRPRLLICDESVSALDVSVQAAILELIGRLRDELGLSVLFISHDLAVVRMLADSVAVLWEGRVVETGPCAQVLHDPAHDYTRMLVAAAARENTSTRED
ncbi:dipeptide ABC transporter ATP-binding protein [Microbacterium fluvii]|uniref:Dipeptide ABC transporter ATP-binding protein n=1 Tax=Microbacterium fluvii TaxID=415215 RepID=A0ABW2H976_9MICO|nr:ABC transporter ATP-binding protein [Microbacterium fluvii]MCU4671280.1 ABC transporter ATP-binding protein [Microbacterium fluvii]